MITSEDIVPIRVTDADINQWQLDRIAKHTLNTWQPNRLDADRAADTRIGKVAEHALEVFLHQHSVGHLSWDAIRMDNFETHAPVDGFLMRLETLARLDVNTFTQKAHAAILSSHFPAEFRDEWETEGVYRYEIKSTRIAKRLQRPDASFDREKVLSDDFLVYPNIRYGNLTPTLRQQLLQQTAKEQVQSLTPRTLFRAYVDTQGSEYTVYLIGYIPRDDFFASSSFTVKNMPQPGKSEYAIYNAVKLEHGFPMSGVVQNLGTGIPSS